MSHPFLVPLLLLFSISLICALLLVPVAKALALRIGLVDKPDGRRKMHARCTPLAGGLAILVTSLITLILFCLIPGPLADLLLGNLGWLGGLLLGALLICALGVADDSGQLRGRYKLLGQMVAVGVVIAFGVRIDSLQVFAWRLDLGALAIPFTVFWLLGAINSLNLIDGMDGLLGTIGGLVCLGLAVMAFLPGHGAPPAGQAAACVAVALGGGLVGFLRYNLPPATIFLGDAGSMLIGLVIGVLAIQCSLKASATVALAAPTALLVIPIFDTTAAIVRRKFTGRSLYSTDRGHLHHCLQRHGLSRSRVLLLITGLGVLTLLGALLSQVSNHDELAILSAAVVIAILVASRLFGYAELVLILKRCEALARGLMGPMQKEGHGVEIQLQGTADWKDFWAQLTAQGADLNLKSISLDVNAPALHQAYHARWYGPVRKSESEEPDQWHIEIPVMAKGQAVGRLSLAGWRDGEPVWVKVETMATLVDQIELVLHADATPGARTPTPEVERAPEPVLDGQASV